LGIHRNLLYRWRKELMEDGETAFPGQGKTSGTEEDMRRLRRENARLREEREILKKALVFFAEESK
jgi:transposase